MRPPSLPVSVSIIGAGRVGSALARALHTAGYPINAIANRSITDHVQQLASLIDAPITSASAALRAADLTVLALPDDTLDHAAIELATSVADNAPRAVVHCSGARSLEPLQPFAERGWLVGSLHPLQSFATRTVAVQSGITWGIEAAEPLRTTLLQIVDHLAGTPLVLRAGDKTLYHAAAVLACNFAITLADQAVRLLGACDLPPDAALAALLPLLHSNLATLTHIGLPDALTGPFARGDVGTVQRHLHALDARAPDIAALYRACAVATLPLLADRGMEPERIDWYEQAIG